MRHHSTAVPAMLPQTATYPVPCTLISSSSSNCCCTVEPAVERAVTMTLLRRSLPLLICMHASNCTKPGAAEAPSAFMHCRNIILCFSKGPEPGQQPKAVCCDGCNTARLISSEVYCRLYCVRLVLTAAGAPGAHLDVAAMMSKITSSNTSATLL